MFRHNIPTAAYKTFGLDNLEEGVKYLETIQGPYVLKADGLAAGKGVITESLEEAQATLKEMIADKKFGDASLKWLSRNF